MNKKIAMEIAVGIILILATIIGGVFWLENKNNLPKKVPSENKILEKSQNDLLSNVSQAVTPVTKIQETPTISQDDSAKWYAEPKEVSLELFQGDNQLPYKIWEVGELKNASGKLYLAVIDNQDPSGLSIMRFVQSNFNTKDLQITLLGKYSSGSLAGYNWNKNLVADSEDNWTNIRSLEFPGIINGPEGSILKKEEDFPTGDGLESVFFDNIKTTFTSQQKVFYDSVFGDFFIGKNQGLHVKSPDGSFKVYSLSMSIMENNDVPKVTWGDGSTNKNPYTFKKAGGCGAFDYASIAADDGISENDLVPLWKTSDGDDVYGLKDKNAEFLKNWYKENIDAFSVDPFKDMNKDGFWSLNGLTDKFSKNTTYQQFLDAHPLFYWRDPLGRLIRFMATDYVMGSGGCGKPVIYLYPEQTTNVSVNVAPTGGMTASDPAYEQGWNVSADPQSNITNLADGKTYPYLFWEGRGDSIYQMPTRGFVASREDLEKLLDEKLSQSGLIQKEINDFKEFWLPKILAENKPYYFVTFVSRREIDKLAPLNISPTPDTIIRVLMDYKGLDNYENVPGFSIKTPERKGFTAVEWGGVLK